MLMVSRMASLIVAAALLGVLAACGPVRSTIVLIQADEALKEARELGSAEVAPYPTTLAQELIEKAREEQGYSSYDTATKLAEEARALARDAVKLARQASATAEDKSEQDKPEGDKSDGDKPEGDKPEQDKSEGDKSEGDKPEQDKPEQDKPEEDRSK